MLIGGNALFQMTSPLATNPRAIAPQQRPASPALPPPSLSQQPHTTIPAALHPPNVPLVSSSHTTSPAVASLGVTPAAPSNGAATTSYPPPIPIAAYPQTQPSYPPLYTPYTALNHSPYLPPAVPSPSHSASSRADVVSYTNVTNCKLYYIVNQLKCIFINVMYARYNTNDYNKTDNYVSERK